MNRRAFIHGAVLTSVAILSGCATSRVKTSKPPRKIGPPPHAPAHGYRRKNRDGLYVEFDKHAGVYIVLDYPSHYYWDGLYYRKYKNHWESTKHPGKHWKKIKKKKLPPGLQNR